MDKYSKIKLLGRGAFGEAWIVQNNINNTKYVMKLINTKKVKLDKIHQEINSLKKISNDYCGKNSYCFEEWFLVYSSTETFYAIVTNYLENAQELTKFMYNLDLPNILFIMQRLLEQLQKFHNMGLTHNDIKPENIIVQFNKDIIKNALFIDFGLGCLDDNCKYSGTIMYMAPEVLKNINKVTTLDNLKRGDIFSLGVVFYRLLNNKFPYPNILDFKHFFPESISSYNSNDSEYYSETESAKQRNLQKQKYIGNDIFPLFTFYKEHDIPPSDYSNSFLHENTVNDLNNLINLMLTKDYTKRPDINQLMTLFYKINLLILESKYPSNNMLSPNKKLQSFTNLNYESYSE